MAAMTDYYPVRLPSDVGKLGEETPILTRAYSESFQTGSFLPILKQELRYKIQSRRMENGQPELHVKFEGETKHPLTRLELEKLESRKRHNRHSAKKCREKKKSEEKECVRELDYLRAKNKELWAQFHKHTHWKQILIKKLLKQLLGGGSNVSEAEFLNLLPDLVQLRQAEKDLFVKNNVERPEFVGNQNSEWNSEVGKPSIKPSIPHNAMLQHSHVLDWLKQCEGVQPEVGIQPEVELQAERDLQHKSCKVMGEVNSQPEVQSQPDIFVQENMEIQPNFTVFQQIAPLQALQQTGIPFIQEVEIQQDSVIHEVEIQLQQDSVKQQVDLQQDCRTQEVELQQGLVVQEVELQQGLVVQEVELHVDSLLRDYTEFPYQQTNAVLQGLDFLLSDTT
ncbi:uncharacterized protein LOC117339464 isoform X2 [Pecten maximus]|uniref:uncharacterized protein LOC117339464 isoform X2 n=1 Tax=Pecten maximus TaxID=6579 RepID=UPI0014587480|nr:uncharacterized protein LOC117339464 isoform X2 [Pecten maximus]